MQIPKNFKRCMYSYAHLQCHLKNSKLLSRKWFCWDDCSDTVCPMVVCPDGSEPPIPEGACCGSMDACPAGIYLQERFRFEYFV